MTTREVLLAAADHIERFGWQQRYFGTPGKPCCLLGAISVAAGNRAGGHAVNSSSADAERAADRRIMQYLRSTHRAIDLVTWNDSPGRTAEEVIAALRGAAEEAVTNPFRR
jgi:hypothetical protein